MKKLLILPILVLLSACVSYYYPETALEDGVYYAEDDPSYVVYQGGYPGAAYYPWSSLDYFYLGYYPYPGYAFYYGYPFGIAHVYSPWHHPYSYYGYYSPRYASYYHYPFYPAWRPYSGYCRHYSGCSRWGNIEQREDRRNRYAGNEKRGRRNRDDDVIDGEEIAVSSPALPVDNGIYATSPFSRYVSTAPAGYSGNRGMVIRNNGATKIGKSRLAPGKSTSVAGARQVEIKPVSSTSSRYPTASTPRASTPRASTTNSRSSRSNFSSPSNRTRVIKSPRRKDEN
jgi:hypothetical protein